MRKEDITPEVIGLAKEISSYWRMEIYEGCWYQYTSLNPLNDEEESCLLLNSDREPISPQKQLDAPTNDIFRGKYIPIPTIADCSDKLRELGYKYLIEYDCDGHWLRVYGGKEKYRSFEVDHQCEHEALLSALLSVLKEGG